MRPLLPNQPRRAGRRALTLVELLIGTALTAVLMVGVMHTIRALSAPGGAVSTARLSADAALDAALRTLAWDVANARLAVVEDSAAGSVITLVGLGALAPGFAGDTDQPARAAEPRRSAAVVTYAVVEAGGRSLLVRRQRELTGDEASGDGSGLVLAGVGAFRARPVGARRGRQAPTPEAGPSASDRALAAAAGVPLNARPRAIAIRLAVAGERPRDTWLTTGAAP